MKSIRFAITRVYGLYLVCLAGYYLFGFHGMALMAQRPYHIRQTAFEQPRQLKAQKDHWQIIFPGNWINAGDDILYVTNGGGYAVGTNEYGDKAKAQRFIVDEPYTIHEIIFFVGAVEGTSGTVDFCIWSFDVRPGNRLARVRIPVSEITATDDMTEAFVVAFDPPVRVTSDYVAGIDLSNIGTSQIGLYSTPDGDGNEMALAWEQWSDRAWHTFLSGWKLDIDLCIFPVVSFGSDDPNVPELQVTAATDKHVSCHGGSDAQATASATGGAPPYTWLWSNGQTFPVAEELPSGTHQVTVTDSQGTQAKASVTISQPPPLQLSLAATSPSANNGSNGTAAATLSGGNPPYSYRWSDPGQQQTATASGLRAGTYAVVATDSNGCSAIAMARLGEPGADNHPHISYDALAIQLKSGSEEIIATEHIRQMRFEFVTHVEETASPLNSMAAVTNYPNPFSQSTTIQFRMDKPGQADIIIYDLTGRTIRRLPCHNCTAGSNELVWDGRDEAGNPLDSGMYIYRLIHDKQVSSHRMVLVR